jgi:hypothetical protein
VTGFGPVTPALIGARIVSGPSDPDRARDPRQSRSAPFAQRRHRPVAVTTTWMREILLQGCRADKTGSGPRILCALMWPMGRVHASWPSTFAACAYTPSTTTGIRLGFRRRYAIGRSNERVSDLVVDGVRERRRGAYCGGPASNGVRTFSFDGCPRAIALRQLTFSHRGSPPCSIRVDGATTPKSSVDARAVPDLPLALPRGWTSSPPPVSGRYQSHGPCRSGPRRWSPPPEARVRILSSPRSEGGDR